jgi:alkanesulfonate monooxygenase SsuD/methylene tetrahydromethanopterin reductase-like flavin-dependent oxidoreductase (luciferase family)
MAEPETAKKSQTKKKLILNAFVEACSGHQSPGLWQHPDDRSSEFNTLQHWVKLAQLLEKAGFHGIFIADVLVCCMKLIASLLFELHWIEAVTDLTAHIQRVHTMHTRAPGTLDPLQAQEPSFQ